MTAVSALVLVAHRGLNPTADAALFTVPSRWPPLSSTTTSRVPATTWALVITCWGANTKPEAEPAPAPPTISQEVIGQTPWPVKTRYVVDLWLHGYAMLIADTSRTPPVRRDYRDAMVVAKNSKNILTKLGVHSKLEALVFAIRHGKVAAAG